MSGAYIDSKMWLEAGSEQLLGSLKQVQSCSCLALMNQQFLNKHKPKHTAGQDQGLKKKMIT